MTRNRVGLLLGLGVFNIFQGIASDTAMARTMSSTTLNHQTPSANPVSRPAPMSGFYLRLSAGVSMPKSTPFKRKPPGTTMTIITDFGVFALDGVQIYAHQSARYQKINIKRGPAFGLALGYQWNPYIRTDIEGQIRTFRINTTTQYESYCPFEIKTRARLHNMSLMGNIFIDLLPKAVVCPFVGGGFGIGYNHLTHSHDKEDGIEEWERARSRRSQNWMYQFTGGFHVGLGPCRLEIFYRYADMGQFKDNNKAQSFVIQRTLMDQRITSGPEVGNPHKGRLKSHEVMMGLRIPLSVFSGGR